MQIAYRSIGPTEKKSLLDFFERVPPTVAGLSNRRVFNAIIRDSLRAQYLGIFVAIVDATPVGYVIFTWEWQNFKRTFMRRHPVVALQAGWRRLVQVVRSRKTNSVKDTDPRPGLPARPDSRWDENSATIAKIIFVGVDPAMRSRGIGVGLYNALTCFLAGKGFRRVDARISLDNTASVRMHERAGWTVQQDAAGYFAFRMVDAQVRGS